MASMTSVIIVPGLHDSGAQHWQSHWQRQLPHAVRIEQTRWDVPDLELWTRSVVDSVRRQGPSWLIAHSFGCLASINALARLPAAQVRGLFLVAPADPAKFNIAAVLPQTALPVPALLVGSRNDPWLSWSRAEQWAQRWQIPLVSAGSAGHINAESGHGAWREGWYLLQQFCEQHQRPQRHRYYLPIAV
jgi:hypothetical protein